ncbi:MAG: DUF1571 domain-containing protein [Pirellulaceae bacterium]
MSVSAFRMAYRAVLVAATFSPSGLVAGEEIRSEPAGIVTKNTNSGPESTSTDSATAKGTQTLPPADDHAGRLQYVLEFARKAASRIDNEVNDYTCILVKRERVDGQISSYQYMHAKIRHEKKEGDKVVVPLSVFLSFLKPERMEGREVLFVENENQGDLIARRGGRRSPNMTVQLPPDHPMAMEGNRYPVSEIGFQNLTRRLIEVLENEQTYNGGVIDIFPDAKVDGRKCTHFRLTHATPRPDLAYCKAEVSVDDELGIPVYFRSFDWPAKAGDPPQLLEEYFYKSVKLNVGLTERDFDLNNPEYHFQLRDKEESLTGKLAAPEGDSQEPEKSTPAGGGVKASASP